MCNKTSILVFLTGFVMMLSISPVEMLSSFQSNLLSNSESNSGSGEGRHLNGNIQMALDEEKRRLNGNGIALANEEEEMEMVAASKGIYKLYFI